MSPHTIIEAPVSEHIFERAIRIKTRDFTLRLPLGIGPSVPIDGFGGWVEIPRPDGRPITEWQGAGALKVDVPIMLNGWPKTSVERDKEKLFKLGRKKDGEEEPPSFKVTGPVFFSGMRMVLNGTPDFDTEQILRNGKNGKLVRIAGVLHLMEYVNGDAIRIARTKKSKGGQGKTYVTKQGDTCRSIAKRELGDVGLANKLAKLNDIRDPRKELEPGTKLRLPGS